MLLQVVEGSSARATHQGAMGDPGAGRERRRHRHRRRPRLTYSRWRATTTLSYIEPYQGPPRPVSAASCATTSSTMGSAADRLPQCAASFGDPEHPKTRHLVSGVVAGIGGYEQLVRGADRRRLRCASTRAYDGNCLVNAMAVGLAPDRQDFLRERRIRRQQADRLSRLEDRARRHPHGATMASAEYLAPTPRRSARPCRSAIRSPRSCCSKPASRSWHQRLRHRLRPGHGPPPGFDTCFRGRNGRQGRSRRHALDLDKECRAARPA